MKVLAKHSGSISKAEVIIKRSNVKELYILVIKL